MQQSLAVRRKELTATLQREQLLDGFVQAVGSKGYAAVTISDIVAKAHVSKSTFYEHFTDKIAVYAELQQRSTDAVAAALLRDIEGTRGLPNRQRITAVVDGYLATLTSDRRWLTQASVDRQVVSDATFRARITANHTLAGVIVGEFPALRPMVARTAIAGMGALVADTAAQGVNAVLDLRDDFIEFWCLLLGEDGPR